MSPKSVLAIDDDLQPRPAHPPVRIALQSLGSSLWAISENKVSVNLYISGTVLSIYWPIDLVYISTVST